MFNRRPIVAGILLLLLCCCCAMLVKQLPEPATIPYREPLIVPVRKKTKKTLVVAEVEVDE